MRQSENNAGFAPRGKSGSGQQKRIGEPIRKIVEKLVRLRTKPSLDRNHAVK